MNIRAKGETLNYPFLFFSFCAVCECEEKYEVTNVRNKRFDCGSRR